MRLLVVNLDVGSGIEYVGSKIYNWVKETNNEVKEFKDQTCVSGFTDILISYKPDIIIVNEYFPRIIEPIYYYKRYNPHIKVLFLPHSANTLINETYNESDHLQKQMVNLFVRDVCDKIIVLSKKISKYEYMFSVNRKVSELYMPVSSEEYRITTPWNLRKKIFGQFGGIGENRLSDEFIEKIKFTDLIIDCYGEGDRIENNKNLIKYPRIKQEIMSKILNEYKFFVLPHFGSEIFFITLLQAIMCGTIPLIVNSSNSETFNPAWLNWADGLIFESNNVSQLIENLIKISKNNEDFTEVSSQISQQSQKQFDENAIKCEIINFLKI